MIYTHTRYPQFRGLSRAKIRSKPMFSQIKPVASSRFDRGKETMKPVGATKAEQYEKA